MAYIEKREGKKGTTYRVQIKRPGLKTITASFDTQAQAKAWAADQESKLVRGVAKVSKAGTIPTFAELAQVYLDEVTAFKKSKQPVSLFKWHSENCEWYHLPINKIRYDHFSEFARIRVNEHKVKPSTVRQHLLTIRNVYRYANEREFVYDTFPADALIKAHAPSKERDRRPSNEEWAQLLEFYSRTPRSYRNWIFIQVAALTAMRRTELATLTTSQVDENGYVKLYNTKNGEDRKFKMPEQALELLDKLEPLEDGRYFNAAPQSISCSFINACKSLGIKNLRLHDLRHEGISSLIEMGLSVSMTKIISGHKSLQSMERYINISPEKVGSEMDRLFKEQESRKLVERANNGEFAEVTNLLANLKEAGLLQTLIERADNVVSINKNAA